MLTQYLLAWVPAFQALTNEEMDELSERMSRRRYATGEAIIRQGDPAEECFVMAFGTAVVTHRERPDASLRTVAILKTGDLFGEIALVEGTLRSASVTAAEETECLVLPADALHRPLQENNAFAIGLLRMAVSRLSEIQRLENS